MKRIIDFNKYSDRLVKLFNEMDDSARFKIIDELEMYNSDTNDVFKYSLSDAWGSPISSVRITEDKNNNVIGLYGCKVEHHTLRKDEIEEIKKIIIKNKVVFNIDDNEWYSAPMVLDGYHNSFYVENDYEFLELEIGNYGYMYDDERLLDLRKLFEEIAEYLISKDVSEKLFLLIPEEIKKRCN